MNTGEVPPVRAEGGGDHHVSVSCFYVVRILFYIKVFIWSHSKKSVCLFCDYVNSNDSGSFCSISVAK